MARVNNSKGFSHHSSIKSAISNIFKGSNKIKSKDGSTTTTMTSTSTSTTDITTEPTQNQGTPPENLLLLTDRIAISTPPPDDDMIEHRELHNRSPFAHRALPPDPPEDEDIGVNNEEEEDENELGVVNHPPPQVYSEEDRKRDYAASIEKVKDCGWYWGPVSGAAAEKLLSSEPDGSFIVRDSSNEHYIFSLTFKLNGSVRHVRIEQDQGNFSFGCLHKFRSSTIVDFIEDAIAHSRSGRYLFFLHRSAVMVPMRVQLKHPVSRFKHMQSLQHLCRFVLLKHVRRDLIPSLPLPSKLKSYLNTPHYYSEGKQEDSTTTTTVSTTLSAF